MKQKVFEISLIIFGAFIFAVGLNVFILPNNLGEGGVTGVTIILFYLYQWSPGLVNFILNSILLVIGYKFLSRQTVIYTIIAVVFNSLFLHLTRHWMIDSNEIIINMAFGGVIIGAGVGLVLRVGGTTAGSAILASIAKKYLGWNISYALLFFDLIVVFASYFVIGMEKLLLTVAMLYIATKVTQFVIEGFSTKKAVTIISQNYEEIAYQVNMKMNRGVTVYDGVGFYSKKGRKVLYIIIGSQEVVRLKRIVENADENAFVAIHDVRDVFGEGFVAIKQQ